MTSLNKTTYETTRISASKAIVLRYVKTLISDPIRGLLSFGGVGSRVVLGFTLKQPSPHLYKSLKYIVTLSLLFSTIFIFPNVAFAEESTWKVETVFGTVNGGELAFENYISLILNFLYGIIGAITVLRLIFAGYRYMQASSNPAEAKSAKQMIWHAIVGLILVISAALITQFINIKLLS